MANERLREVGKPYCPRTSLTPPFRLAYVLRGLFLWVLSRLFLSWAMPMAFMPGAPSPILLPYVAGVVFLIVFGDARIRREDLLLGNAGISPWRGPTLSAGTAFVLELGTQVVMRLPS